MSKLQKYRTYFLDDTYGLNFDICQERKLVFPNTKNGFQSL